MGACWGLGAKLTAASCCCWCSATEPSASPAFWSAPVACREGELDERVVDVEVPATPPRVVAPFGGEGSLQEVVFRVDKFLQPGRGRGEKRKMKVGCWGGMGSSSQDAG
jgi:hypothetical protein